MTAKRDLKKRIRERAARTGERYTAARKHVLGGAGPNGVPFVELQDLSEAAALAGIQCRAYMFPGLAGRVDAAALLRHIRGCLRATERDRATDVLRAVVLDGEQPHIEDNRMAFLLSATLPLVRAVATRRLPADESEAFIARARAGIGGISKSGTMLALPFTGKRGLEMVVCTIWISPPMRALGLPARPPSLILMAAEDFEVGLARGGFAGTR